MDKRFQTVLEIPDVWNSLLGIQSLDDLSSFLEPAPPAEAVENGGLTRADWPKPLRNDRREVSFEEDGYTVALELLSGHENYFFIAALSLPTGERYASTTVAYKIRSEELIEIRGVGKFRWRQQLVKASTSHDLRLVES